MEFAFLKIWVVLQINIAELFLKSNLSEKSIIYCTISYVDKVNTDGIIEQALMFKNLEASSCFYNCLFEEK